MMGDIQQVHGKVHCAVKRNQPEEPQSPQISGCERDLVRDILLNSLSLFAKHIHFVLTQHNFSNE